MSNKGAPSNWPPTFPRFLRNSAMMPAFQSLIVIDGRYIVTRRDLLTSNIEKLATWYCRDNPPQPCVKIRKVYDKLALETTSSIAKLFRIRNNKDCVIYEY